MSSGIDQLMDLPHNSITKATVSSHGKYWSKWLNFVLDGNKLDVKLCMRATFWYYRADVFTKSLIFFS